MSHRSPAVCPTLTCPTCHHMSHRSPALFSRPLSHAHPARRHAHLSVRLYVHPVCTPLSVRLYVQHHTPAPGITSGSDNNSREPR